MLRRVAASGLAWSLVLFLVIWPVRFGIDAGTLDEFRQTALPAPFHDAQAADDGVGKIGNAEIKLADADGNTQKSVQGDAPVQTAALEPATPTVAEPFGLAAEPIASNDVVTKWAGVEARIGADDEILARCRDDATSCPEAARNFLSIIAQGRALSGRARIGVINRAVNLAIEPMSDLAQWGVADRWSPPLETFTTGRGDCEDYAIAKYVALTAAGVPAQDVKLIIVRNLALGEEHAVVTVHSEGSWVVLDNRWLTMVDDVDMAKVVPLFVLDGSGVRRYEAPVVATGQTAAPASLNF